MSSSWVVAGQKNKGRRNARKERKDEPPKPPVALNVDDWTDSFNELDQNIYNVLLKAHPKAMSPESVLAQLPIKSCTLKEVWKSLDASYIQRYIERISHYEWALKVQTPHDYDDDDVSCFFIFALCMFVGRVVKWALLTEPQSQQ